MESTQIRLRTLLKDDLMYRKWFLKEPKITVRHTTPPFRVYLQREKGGRWARVDLPTYAQAFTAVKARLSEYWDMTIHVKPQGFSPPRLKISGQRDYLPVPEGHQWCIYCRRATVFDYFSKHHALIAVNYEEKRCSICGARAEAMPTFPSLLSWPVQSGKQST